MDNLDGKTERARRDITLHVRVTAAQRAQIERIQASYQRRAPRGMTISFGDAMRALLLDGARRAEEDERGELGLPSPVDCSAE